MVVAAGVKAELGLARNPRSVPVIQTPASAAPHAVARVPQEMLWPKFDRLSRDRLCLLAVAQASELLVEILNLLAQVLVQLTQKALLDLADAFATDVVGCAQLAQGDRVFG